MAKKRIPVRKIKETLRLIHEVGLSQRQTALAIRVGRSTVQEYPARAARAGLTWPLPDDMDDTTLERLLYVAEEKGAGIVREDPDWKAVSTEKRRKGVTLQLLWEEYRAGNENAYSYSRFCERYATWRKKLHPTMRFDHKAGERAFIDYAGLTAPYIDAQTGESREAQVFVAVLGASNYMYVVAQTSQDLGNWLMGHVLAFEFWGGVPELLVVDNLNSGVTSPCRYEPDVNPSYYELAVHYHTAVVPARVRKPRDKPKAEVGVEVAERWLIAPLRHVPLVGLAGLNRALWERMDLVHNRPMRHLGKSRRQLFEELERPALKPLPATRFEVGDWKGAKVGIDYHFEFDHHFYSVPYELIHEAVEIRATARVIEVYRRGVRIEAYCRSYVRGGHTTRPEHMPEGYRAHLEWTPERLLRWAGEVGPNTARLAHAVMQSRDHPEQGFRSCLGIMRLSKDHPTERMEAAAHRALEHGVHSYKGLKRILASGLDGPPADEEPPPSPARSQENLRGSDYYAKKGESETC